MVEVVVLLPHLVDILGIRWRLGNRTVGAARSLVVGSQKQHLEVEQVGKRSNLIGVDTLARPVVEQAW